MNRERLYFAVVLISLFVVLEMPNSTLQRMGLVSQAQCKQSNLQAAKKELIYALNLVLILGCMYAANIGFV